MNISKKQLEQLYLKEKKTPQEIAVLYGLKSRTSIINRLYKYNIPIRGYNQKYWPIDNFFSKWSSDMAYCLGFLSADGHVWKDRPFITIGIHKKDIEILEYIVSCISPKTIIRDGNSNKKQICIRSDQIHQDLVKLGCDHSKTFNLRIPGQLPKKYLRDYIRGYFDGDGSIFTYNNRKTYRASFSTASKDMAYDLVAAIGFGKIRILREKYYEVGFNQSQTIILGQFMYYEGCFALKRKKAKFDNIKILWSKWSTEEDLLLKKNLDKNKTTLAKIFPNRGIHGIWHRRNKFLKIQNETSKNKKNKSSRKQANYRYRNK